MTAICLNSKNVWQNILKNNRKMTHTGETMKNTIESVKNEIRKGIIGQEDFIHGLLLAILADGHVLIEGVPGLAKTRAVQLLANASGLSFQRIQFTPDLLPADIIGTRIYNQSTADFETKKGPVFANFILADEINRAPAKVQSALLEAMQEKQVTIGDETFPLPGPFFVFATMNPVEQEGTYNLPEAQLDRFMCKLVVDYPKQEEEEDIVSMIIEETSLPEVNEVISSDAIRKLQKQVRAVHLEKKLIHYISDIVFAGRFPEKYNLQISEQIQYGGSPRASISLAKAAQANAFIEGRDYASPEDVRRVAYHVLRHRILVTYFAQADGITSKDIIKTVIDAIRVP